MFGLLEGDEVRRAGDRLVELMAGNGYHIGTGFAGTPMVADALALTGHHDEAYHLLLTDTCPSWLYAVGMGATTIWERWDSMLPDGSINPGGMTSFNHYALGAVADYMERVVGGLALASPGGRKLRVAPRPGGGLTSCETTRVTPYGEARVAWSRSGGTLTVDVSVPAGSSAMIELPGREVREVGSGTHQFSVDYRAVEDDPARPEHQDPLAAAFGAGHAAFAAAIESDGGPAYPR